MLKNFKGIAYRSHNPKWAFQPTSGKGAQLTGGRFNKKGIPALYLSLSQIGALLESQQGFSHKAQPKLICAYQVDVENIVDLTDAKVRAYYDISLTKLDCAWFIEENPYPHQVVDRLMRQKVSGIIVPSFASGAKDCTNLVLWKWSSRKPNKVTVIDDNKALPKNQDSWL